MLSRYLRQNHTKKLNILTAPTHERYESMLVKTGHNFYAFRGQGIKDWNTNYAPLPDNYHLLPYYNNNDVLPPHIDFDLVLSQNKAGQFQVLSKYANMLRVPLISLEHTLPYPNWPQSTLVQCRQMAGHVNVFISEYSRKQWGWTEEADVIHHGVDSEFFTDLGTERKPVILSVVNDWINRDQPCGFRLWQHVTQGLPVLPVGDTPGLSKPAGVDELKTHYNSAQIFINTSLISPIPTALLEAMSCGCAVITTNNCMIPEIVKHNENGILCNSTEDFQYWLPKLLNDKELCKRLGKTARETIVKRFSVEKFVNNWNNVFEKAINIL